MKTTLDSLPGTSREQFGGLLLLAKGMRAKFAIWMGLQPMLPTRPRRASAASHQPHSRRRGGDTRVGQSIVGRSIVGRSIVGRFIVGRSVRALSLMTSPP